MRRPALSSAQPSRHRAQPGLTPGPAPTQATGSSCSETVLPELVCLGLTVQMEVRRLEMAHTRDRLAKEEKIRKEVELQKKIKGNRSLLLKLRK